MADEVENMVPKGQLCPRVRQLHHNKAGLDKSFGAWWRAMDPVRETFDAYMDTSQTHGGKDSGSLERYFDTVNTRHCHKQGALHSFGQPSKLLPSDVIAEVVEGASWEILYQYKLSPYADEFIRLVLGPFFKQLTADIVGVVARAAVSPEGPRAAGIPKLHIFSAHDSTISPLLGSLKMPDDHYNWPPYASNIIWELWTFGDKEDVEGMDVDGFGRSSSSTADDVKELIAEMQQLLDEAHVYSSAKVKQANRLFHPLIKSLGGAGIRALRRTHVRALYNGRIVESEWCDMEACPLSHFLLYYVTKYVTGTADEYAKECAPYPVHSGASSSAAAF